ncbi:MAG TPA: ABC transporter permease [Paenirhodobacter sp.]
MTDLSLSAAPPARFALLRRLVSDPMGAIGLAIVVLVVLAAVFAPMIAPYDPLAMDMKARLASPSALHLLGTDQMGRDTFSRMIMGTRVALQVAIPSTLAALMIGTTLGMIAGFGPRWLDAAISFLFDLLRSYPTVMLALALVALFGPSLATVLVVVILTSIPIYGRVARTQTMAIRGEDYIIAEQAMGAGLPRILFRHIGPNIIGPLVVLASMDIPAVIALEAGLSFLGMGVKPPAPSWGALLKDGYSLIRSTPWLVIAGAIPIVITTLGYTFLGEALRDATDPRAHRN